MLLFALLLLVVGVSACGVTSASAGGATPTATPIQATNTPTDAPTSTPDAIAVICAGTPGTHVDALPADEPVPAGAILSSQGSGGTGSGGGTTAITFEKVGVCVSGMTPDAIRAFYSAQMPAKGWSRSATFPYNGGDLNTACRDAYCWKQNPGNNSTTAVALENVRAYGATTAYTLEHVSYGS